MCHSVEMYMPSLARRAAEHRLGTARATVTPRWRTPGLSPALMVRLAGQLQTLAAWRPTLRPETARTVETAR